jgi:penicillin-binding protein 2
MRRRVKLILIIFALFLILLVSRLYFLSIKSNAYYERLSHENITKTEFYTAPRGEIKDRNGIDLAINKLGFSLLLKPHLKKDELRFALDFISKNLSDYDIEKIKNIYTRSNSPYNHKDIKVINFIPYDKLISKFVLFKSQDIFIISPSSKRFYPQGEMMAHILGYVAKADKKDEESSKITKLIGLSGKTGIEKYYNTLLQGSLGEKEKKVTALNKTLRTIKDIKPTSSNLTLSVDVRVQEFIKELFLDLSGAIIVMDANDGSILAAGSYPEYDNNDFVNGISQDDWQDMIKDLNHPFTNKFIHGLYPPGSSTKPQVLLSYLNSKLINANENLLCEGEISLGKRKFRCWNQYGHGEVDAKKAIKESCDVYFYKGGLRVGIDKISTDLSRYEFGKKTGVDLPSEFIGTVPSRNWKIEKFGEGWHKGETLNTVIGQGDFLVTPLQVATATALIATGKLVTPHFIKSIDEQNITFKKEDILTPLEKKNLPYIQEGMYEVCNKKGGTAYKYNSAKIKIAGKTGTSQVVGIPQDEIKRMSEDDLKYFKKSHAWFTTYAPYKNPQFIVTAIIEHGGHGGSAAGEIVSKVYNYLLALGYIRD